MQLVPVSDRLRGTAVHRQQLRGEGYSAEQLRAAVRAGAVELYRRAWFVGRDAPSDLRDAARWGGRVSCTTFARRRGWWMPEGVEEEVHLHFPPGSTGPRAPWGGVAHWAQPIAPLGRSLVATIEDALAHIAVCLPPEQALVLWESAAGLERLAPEALRAIRWPSRAAALAAEVTGLADSGLEVLVCRPLRRLRVSRASTGLSRGKARRRPRRRVARDPDRRLGAPLIVHAAVPRTSRTMPNCGCAATPCCDSPTRRSCTTPPASSARSAGRSPPVSTTARSRNPSRSRNPPVRARAASVPSWGGSPGPGLRHSRDGVASG